MASGVSMVRIRAEIRDQTISNLLKKKFLQDDLKLEEMREALDKEEKELWKTAYETCFTRREIVMMEAMPAGWMPKAVSVHIRIEDPKNPANYTDTQVYWGTVYAISPEDYERYARPIPYKLKNSSAFAKVIPNTDPYVVALNAYREHKKDFDKASADLRDRKHAAAAKVRTIIESVTTVKRLLEIWPEVQEFLPELVSGEAGQVPAEMIADINKEYGIEPKKAA